MVATEEKLSAYCANAKCSTGPTTVVGKMNSSRNALRHGLLSTRLFLQDEDPAEFQFLLDDLGATLNPVGAIELAIVQRIALSLWRQRRLVQAETASIALNRTSRHVTSGVSGAMARGYGNELNPEALAPFDAEQECWARATLAEIDGLQNLDLQSVQASAPRLLGQLQDDAEDDGIEKFLANQKDGLAGYVAELALWCRKQLREAEARPEILALAEHVKAQRLALPADALELFSRYQTTLDNQLYKALKALRQAQEWRLKTLEASPNPSVKDELEPADPV